MLGMNEKESALEVINLNASKLNQEIESIISKIKEGDEVHLYCEVDFSTNLINVMNEKFAELPIKAKMLTKGDSGMTIKIKYPKAGEGCCGSCS